MSGHLSASWFVPTRETPEGPHTGLARLHTLIQITKEQGGNRHYLLRDSLPPMMVWY